MLIVNPSFGQSAGGGETLAAASVDWMKDPIALFSNSKPNARELLEGVREQLAAFRPVDNIDFVYKDSASQPAPDDVMDHVVKNYKAALLAIAD